jgi:hypothetical protein
MERIKKPVFPKGMVSDIEQVTQSSVSKWIPLICAGAAAGVSIIALQEIKKVRQELIVIKKEQCSSGVSDEVNKRMENIENQMKILTSYLKPPASSVVKEEVSNVKIFTGHNKPPISSVVKEVIKEEPTIKIINDEEYEEIEVTDDEAEEN